MLASKPLPPTPPPALEAAVARVRASAPAWARQPTAARADLARRLLGGVAATAERSVLAACAAKSIDPSSPVAGEEWMAGPYVTLRVLRQLAGSLDALARGALPPAGRLTRRRGRVVARLFPAGLHDRALYGALGLSAEVRFERGLAVPDVRERQAAEHRRPTHGGRTCLVLGAGNVNSIPTTDVLTKLFVERKACVLKLNPVNGYLGPLLEEAFAEAIAAGWLAVVHGGAEEGAWLAHHPGIDEVHVTGSERTHAALLRGPPALDKEVTSELGNVTPVLVVPGPYGERDLAAQAENVAGMVTHNASFNCVAAKVLVLPRGWRHRDRFLSLLGEALARAPARAAWYPGARERWEAFTAGRRDLRVAPRGGPGTLPWAIAAGLDPGDGAERAFREESFCAVLAETSVGGEEPVEYLRAATRFANERLRGTLAAAIVVHPECERGAPGEALEQAISELRYGTVCLNLWPGFAFATGTTPWGAHPGATRAGPGSGRGFVHDTRMLGGVEKTVMRAPLRPIARLPYVPGHRTAHRLGRRLVALEATGSPLHLGAAMAEALLG